MNHTIPKKFNLDTFILLKAVKHPFKKKKSKHLDPI